ncbi:hypothetical protein OIU34_30930 [Pararhizobium sp. BT-229]|uniref:hypothetical protein n=1 Tax=Pararhizobium sp. BT-229 TaxID=2986923 RepID=UPI0021F78C4B|nr:hypothetical protein [Pararhizobium sp. BT-229]MCV9966293.1 hypothetical protein [Pararhizobium sp. BT-229]
MFYHGGMTLGYLTPPAKPEKTVRSEAVLRQSREDVTEFERERDQDLSRAFLTPWHLFY